jgi:hypothetical protein
MDSAKKIVDQVEKIGFSTDNFAFGSGGKISD